MNTAQMPPTQRGFICFDAELNDASITKVIAPGDLDASCICHQTDVGGTIRQWIVEGPKDNQMRTQWGFGHRLLREPHTR